MKLSKTNAVLFKIRRYIDLKTLKLIYHVIFESYLPYASLVGAQNSSLVEKLDMLQKFTQRSVFSKQKCSNKASFQKPDNFKLTTDKEHLRIIY